jgi:AcrR family transcriptional regulator
MAERLGETVGKPSERGGLLEIRTHASCAVALDLRSVGSLLTRDLLSRPRPSRLGFWLRWHEQIVDGRLPIYTVSIAPADQPLSARPADPRRLILHALIETAAREGYAHTCIERVLSAANLAEADFYAYFESLEDCFIQASDELIDELELVVLGRMSIDAPWPERIRRGLRAMLSVISKHPDRARFVMIECLGAGQPAAERLRSAEAMFAVVIEEGGEYASSVERLSVEHLSELTAEGVVGSIVAIVHRRVFEENTAELPALLSDLLYIVLMPYLGHERALAAA